MTDAKTSNIITVTTTVVLVGSESYKLSLPQL